MPDWLMIDQSKAIKIHRYEKNWGIIFYDYIYKPLKQQQKEESVKHA